MAKILKPPSQEIIDGFKGTLDYYVWNGLLCVRSWPKSPGHDRTSSVQEQWPAFSWASKSWQLLDSETQQSFNRMAAGTNLTGRDVFTKSYLSSSHIRNVP